jgi:plasmid stabilization system protein ParE
MAHRLAPQAEAALDAIWSHGAEASGSIESADRLIDSITARFLLLADNPFLGRARDATPPVSRSRPSAKTTPPGPSRTAWAAWKGSAPFLVRHADARAPARLARGS